MTGQRRVSTRNDRHGQCTTSRKGTRMPNRRLRGKRGGLESMPHMPLDVLFEVSTRGASTSTASQLTYSFNKIMKYLMPRDLLQLARTTKGFRSFLISRPSSGLWKVARENVKGLPCCPSHPSEPAWASLAFETNCNVSSMLESIRTC